MDRLARVATLLTVLTCACTDAAPESASTEAADTSRDSLAPDVSQTEPADSTPASSGCIRGGTPREEVRRILGEPDSVSFGAWLYGGSEIQFGYGVVVETRDPDGRLHLCD